jgi:nucleoside-diphosphate-sugar epimerase
VCHAWRVLDLPENLTWVGATLGLLREFMDAGGQRLVCAGTCAEYDWQYGYCVEDLTPLAPATLYGAAKHGTAVVVRQLAEQRGVSWAWGRLFFLFGPHEHPRRLIPSVINGMLDGRAVPCSEGTQRRDFLHVGDAASALASLLDSDQHGAVNIASGTAIAVRDIVEEIGRQLRTPGLARFGALPGDGTPAIVASTERLRTKVGWSPRYGLADGLSDAIAWWTTQRKEAARP